MADEQQLAQIRSFNRVLTRRIGVLNNNYLESGLPLAEARLLFEIGRTGATARELRTRLGLDSGYLSRLLRQLEQSGFILTQRDAADARVRRMSLTPKGEDQWQTLEMRSKELAASMLAPLDEAQRARLVAAMAEVERLIRASAVVIEAGDPFSEEARACIASYFRELGSRLDGGFDPELSISARPEELIPPKGWFFLAHLDGVPVGCGALKVLAPGRGELKRMWVAPAARGLGIARRLLATLERQAQQAGLTVLQLDTHRSLGEARALYARHGYVEIAPYNSNPYADHWFQKSLAGSGAAGTPQ